MNLGSLRSNDYPITSINYQGNRFEMLWLFASECRESPFPLCPKVCTIHPGVSSFIVVTPKATPFLQTVLLKRNESSFACPPLRGVLCSSQSQRTERFILAFSRDLSSCFVSETFVFIAVGLFDVKDFQRKEIYS